MKKYFVSIVLAGMLVACGGNTAVSPLEFSNYEKTEEGVTPEGAPAELSLSIAIPQGEGETQTKITEVIKGIIAGSDIAEAICAPEGETLQAIVDNYVEQFKKGLKEGELPGACIYQLGIDCQYQNTQAVVFNVTDGVYGNGGPHYYYKIVKLSDGQVVERNQITTLTDDNVKQLASQFAEEESKEQVQYMEEDGFWLAPDSAGSKLMIQVGSHFFYDFNVPAEVILPYLTEEGKTLFEIADASAATKAEEETTQEPVAEAPKAEPGKAELGIFDLRGPVKKCVWGEMTYTFDENGFWQTQNGQKLSRLFPGGVERDKAGRISYGNADAYGSIGYVYNAQGLATEINEDGFSRQLTYDAEGYVCKETQTIAPDMGDEEGEGEVVNLSYTILEKDEVGNWIKRKDQNGKIEKRTITYYE